MDMNYVAPATSMTMKRLKRLAKFQFVKETRGFDKADLVGAIKKARINKFGVDWALDVRDLMVRADVELEPLSHEDRVYHLRFGQHNPTTKPCWLKVLRETGKEEFLTSDKFRETRERCELALSDPDTGDRMAEVADACGKAKLTSLKLSI